MSRTNNEKGDRNPIAQLSADLSAVSLQMNTDAEKTSLSQYFNKSSKSDSFFDQISGTTSGNTAMMTSIRESPSAQDLSNTEQPTITRPNYFDSLLSRSSDNSLLEPHEFSPTTSPPTSDPFTPGTEADRRCNAWIPNEETRRILVLSATSPPGSFTPDPDLLTKPGVVLEEDMIDTVHEVVLHYLGEEEASKRKVLTALDVTQDDRGLRELIKAECYRAAVNLTGRILTMYGQGAGRAGHPTKHTPHSIQLWFTRIALLIKIRSFSLAEVESEPFGDLDRPDLYFQYYPDMHGSRQGCMVPFSFRLILAELPQYLNKGKEAMAKLHVILAVIRKILKNLDSGLSEDGSPINLNDTDRSESKKLWESRETRVLYSIANCAIYQKDFELAINVIEMLKTREPAKEKLLNSALGRVLLMLGDVNMADKFLLPLDTTNVQSHIDRGLASIAQNAFQDAHDIFSSALQLDPKNILVINNMAVCLLYLGRLKDAITVLEKSLSNNPKTALHESVLLNICTLYELESSFCLEQKLSILKLLAQYKGDGIHMGCLKLQV